MPFKSENFFDEPVTPSRRARLWTETDGMTAWPQKKRARPEQQDAFAQVAETGESALPDDNASSSSQREARSSAKKWPTLKRAHALSFVGLLLFTAVTYFRPYELIPALSNFTSMAFWLAVATLLVFIPTQLSVEGTVTARPREVHLILLLALAALLSVPYAIEPAEAWPKFVDFAKVVTMFIVMINVVRTEMRLRLMFWLSLLVGVVLSVSALNDYLQGHFDKGSDRIVGVIRHGLFENPNDMALYLVTLIPLALGLLFIARGINKKLFYGLCALLMVAGTVVTLSRGGFLGLACALFVMAWKIGRRNRLGVVILFVLAGVIFFLAVPPEFISRLLSSVGENAEASAVARQNLLWRSIEVTLRHPLFGIGMSNFPNVSIHDQVTHNAYTQVSAEMGIPALILYVLFILSSLKRLRSVERETYDSRSRSRVFYLSVGLQASLVGYMVSSFFASVAYLWYIYYLVGYAVCLHRLYDAKGATAVFGRKHASQPLNMGEESTDAPAATFAESHLAAHHER